MKSLTKTEIIELAKKHSLPISTPVVWEFVELGLLEFVSDVLNAATIGRTQSPSIGAADAFASQFAAVPLVTICLQSNTLAGLANALSALAENADRKRRGVDFCNLTSGEEITCLRALASVAAESSRKLAAIARNEAGALQ